MTKVINVPLKPMTRIDRVREMNYRKVDRIFNRFMQPKYSMNIEFDLNSEQDINDPSNWLRKHSNRLSRLEMGSGFNFMNGMRDFHYEGTEHEMQDILTAFCQTGFKIHHIYVYPCDWAENENGSKWCLTTAPLWNAPYEVRQAKEKARKAKIKAKIKRKSKKNKK